MKKKNLLITGISIILLLSSCSMAEISSEPRNFKILITENQNDSLQLFLHQGAGEYIEIQPVEKVYNIEIPSMRGGYTVFFGMKFNKHLPEDYDVVKLMKGEKIIEEFSINDIDNFVKDENGRVIINVN
jgi:hypothetical protein